VALGNYSTSEFLEAFGSVRWNKAEDKILYIAEKWRPSPRSFFSKEEVKDGKSRAKVCYFNVYIRVIPLPIDTYRYE
jgi:hypothetical protein